MRHTLTAAGAVAATLLAVGLVSAGCTAPPPVEPDGPAVTEQAAPSVAVADPAEIVIPALDVRAAMVATGRTPDGGWQVPPLERPEQPSWFRPGPEPGEPGTAVVLGHVNGSGRPGVFARLHELGAGAEILVADQAGELRAFRVTDVRRVDKVAFDTAGLEVGGPPRLVLYTCGGELAVRPDGSRHYDQNVVITALAV